MMKQHPIFRKDKKRISRVLFISLAVFMAVVVGLSSCIQNGKQQTSVKGPHLEKRGDVTQLIVKGKPWLVLGCELGNSTSSSRSYLAPYWQQLKESGVNTVLAVVSWEQTEPEEGRFDFTVVDNLLEDARQNGMKLALLWFGSWKNGITSYTRCQITEIWLMAQN